MENCCLNFKNLSFTELQEYLKEQNIPVYRGRQIFNWLYQKKAFSWDEMTDLPKELRRRFIDLNVGINSLRLVSRIRDNDGTEKYLFELEDQSKIESVYLPESDRNTVCFSTQVGCGMGCLFCATGRNGIVRNLTVGVIIDQILNISKLTGTQITNIVAMGQGEPLLNYESLMKTLRILNDPKGLGLGARRITISTCGIIPGVLKLAEADLQVNLAISLHAADNQLRDHLMPINKKYPLEKLLEACDHYIAKTNRRVTFEYALIDGINDRKEDLQRLIKLLTGKLCHVNLIPFNPIPDTNFRRSNPKTIAEFAAGLNSAHIETTVRKERGSALTAACGQLQSKG